MKKLFLLFICIGVLQISLLQAAELKVDLAQTSLYEAGNAAGIPPAEVISLVISGGTITRDDFSFITSQLPYLQRLDMSGATASENTIPSFGPLWQLTVVIFPKGVTNIDAGAFASTGLTSVTIPATVTSIGANAFRSCTGLTYVHVPASVKSIGNGAFSGCTELKSVTLTEGLTILESYAFSGCSGLTTIAIPASVTNIGSGAFAGCSGLVSINVTTGNTVFRSKDGILFNADMTRLLVYPAGRTATNYTVPASITSIAPSAFAGCSHLTDLSVIESTAYRSEAGVLYNADRTQLLWYPSGKAGTSYTIPNGVKSIAEGAFQGCTKLTSVNFPLAMTHIGDGAFYGCTGLTGIQFPAFVVTIGSDAFRGCSGISNIYIPPSVTSVGNSAFAGCSGITDVFIPASIKSFGTGVFEGCTDLGLVMISNGLTAIPSSTFYGCNRLADITIPPSVKSIGNYSFTGCTGLTNMTIPSSVTTIGNSVFAGCINLTSVTIPPSVTDIGSFAFSDCISLASVTIPPSVMNMGTNAFYNCTGLIAAAFSEGISSIPRSTFYGCTGLTVVSIPQSVTSIGLSAFKGCTVLTSVTIPTSVASIEGVAFEGCSSLTSVYAYSPQPVNLSMSWGVFRDINSDCILYVPRVSEGAYYSALQWQDFRHILYMDSPWQLELNKQEMVLKIGGTETLTATVTPAGADKAIRWISDRPDIATVDIAGRVTGISAGVTFLYAISASEDVGAGCMVTVTNENTITHIRLSKTNIGMLVGDTEQLSAYIEPSDSPAKTITWTSNNAAVVTVNATGKMNAVERGTALVTATLADGTKAICRVYVSLLPPDISLDNKELVLSVGGNKQLVATVTPENTPDKSVVWITDHPEIAEVDASGKVTGISQGTAVITAFTKAGNKRAICLVTVGETTGIEIADAPLARMYPNPTGGLFTLDFELPGVHHVTITTATGKILLRQTISDPVKQMDISSYPAGVYMLVIDDCKRQSATKIVKR